MGIVGCIFDSQGFYLFISFLEQKEYRNLVGDQDLLLLIRLILPYSEKKKRITHKDTPWDAFLTAVVTVLLPEDL